MAVGLVLFVYMHPTGTVIGRLQILCSGIQGWSGTSHLPPLGTIIFGKLFLSEDGGAATAATNFCHQNL
jgi:hypothetical protein